MREASHPRSFDHNVSSVMAGTGDEESSGAVAPASCNLLRFDTTFI